MTTDHAFLAHPKLREALEKLATTVTKKSGAVLFRQGQSPKGVFLLRTGKAVLTVRATEDGAGVPRNVGPGAVLGLPSSICGKPFSLSAQVVEDSELGFVERAKVVKLLRQDGSLCLHAVEVVGRELAALRNELAQVPRPSPLRATAV